jgi:hypothetical protein
MGRTVVIQLPDELDEQLENEARRCNMSLQEVVLQSLRQRIGQEVIPWQDDDPIAPLLGSLKIEDGLSDLAERHDHYVGNAVWNELTRAE